MMNSTENVIMFYSEFCPHSKMLLDTIQRHDTKKMITVACVESILKSGKTLPKIHSVPALITIPDKRLLFGKDVFDFLLLPGRGLLTRSDRGDTNAASNPRQSHSASSDTPAQDEPSAFSMRANGFSDSYSAIEDTSENDRGLSDRLYNWTHLDALGTTGATGATASDDVMLNKDSRTKKELPDLGEFQARRAMELNQSDLNMYPLPPSISGRE